MSDATLFWIKGVLALLGLMLLLWHMFSMEEDLSPARTLRYVALLIAASAVAFASQEQIREQAEWVAFNWGGMAAATAITAASIASLLEDRGITLRRRRKP